jgi:hypothetical protein
MIRSAASTSASATTRREGTSPVVGQAVRMPATDCWIHSSGANTAGPVVLGRLSVLSCGLR